MKWEEAPDLKSEIEKIVEKVEYFKFVKVDRVHCFRTSGSKARAYARIWSFPKIFQQVLSAEPAYVIEAITEKFNRLSSEEKTKVLIHELLHIPSNFSGSLLPHKFGHKRINRETEILYREMMGLKEIMVSRPVVKRVRKVKKQKPKSLLEQLFNKRR